MKHLGKKKLRDDIRVLHDQGLSLDSIAKNLNRRGETVSKSTVRRQLMWEDKMKEKNYAPTSVPKPMHSRVRGLIRKLYCRNGHRTTAQVVRMIEEEFGLTVRYLFKLWKVSIDI